MKGIVKKLMTIVILLMIIFTQTSMVIAASTIWVGVRALRDDTGYRLEGNKVAWKLLDYGSGASASSTPNLNTAIYCLYEGRGFTSPDGSNTLAFTDIQNVRVKYDASEVMEINQSGLSSAYNSVLWILDHCYLPKNNLRAKLKTQLLSNALAFFEANKNNSSVIDADVSVNLQGYKVSDFLLTDSDIEVVQQAAIWRYTNFLSNSNWAGLPTVDLIDGTGVKIQSLVDVGSPATNEGYIRNVEAKLLYTYLITEAGKNMSLYATQRKTEPEITMTDTNAEISKTASSSIIGPFNYTLTDNGKMITGINSSVKIANSSNSTLTTTANYTILKSDKTTVTTIDQVKGQDFYIKINDTTVKKAEVTVTAKYYMPTVTAWSVNGDDSQQPIAIVDGTEKEKDCTGNAKIEEFDLALRKYITKVTDGSNNVVNIDTRVPAIDASTLNTGTTATYNHRKDPISIKTGYKVQYTLTVYNEGDIAGRATQIIDQLPAGLKFLSVVSGDYIANYDTGANKVTLTKKGAQDLAAYSGTGTPSSEQVVLECEVTATLGAADQVLTNIAWISADSNGNDRDSRTGGISISIRFTKL